MRGKEWSRYTKCTFTVTLSSEPETSLGLFWKVLMLPSQLFVLFCPQGPVSLCHSMWHSKPSAHRLCDGPRPAPSTHPPPANAGIWGSLAARGRGQREGMGCTVDGFTHGGGEWSGVEGSLPACLRRWQARSLGTGHPAVCSGSRPTRRPRCSGRPRSSWCFLTKSRKRTSLPLGQILGGLQVSGMTGAPVLAPGQQAGGREVAPLLALAESTCVRTTCPAPPTAATTPMQTSQPLRSWGTVRK